MTIACFTIVSSNAQIIKNFQLKDLDNQSQTFEGLKGGKITLIDFWASWCKPCNKALPELNKIYETYIDRGVQIIGINCDGPRSVSKVAPFLKSLQIKYPNLLDTDAEIMSDLNLTAFPTLIIVNSQGKILWIHEGYVTGDAEVITAEIDKNISGE